MSHFTVTVRVTAERLAKHKGSVEKAVGEMLTPFEESPGHLSPYLVFEDHHDDALKTYEGYKDTQSFEEFCKDYGYVRNGDGLRYGLWCNPNAKWDWWTIGGRWSGFYPVKGKPVVGKPGSGDNKPKPGHGDIVKVGDIDMDAVAAEATKRLDSFFARYQRLLAGEKMDWKEDPRDEALSRGLITVVQGPAEATDGAVVVPWATAYPHCGGERASWHDVCRKIDRATLEAEFAHTFNPISTYAALDDDGWHASGEMGWWGCSTDKPDDKVSFQKAFVDRFIKTAAPDDLLVVVDCHI